MRDSDQDHEYAIALDVSDPVLQDALAERLEDHPGLREASADEAPDIVIVDEIGYGAGRGSSQTLVLGHYEDAALPMHADPNLILAVAYVMAAGYGIAPRDSQMPLTAAQTRNDADGEEASVVLTPRERDVVSLLVEGASNKQIARTLGITERTAKFHVIAVIRKLHARNRSEVVAIALRDGLVEL